MALLSDYAIFSNGKKRPAKEGVYPVYGGNGILGYSDEFNMEKGIIIGRVGAYCGSVFVENGKCWVSDNAIKVENRNNSDLNYLYYLLSFLRLNNRSIGTSQPLLTQGILNSIQVNIPSKDIQTKVAEILLSIDHKIHLNNKINQNLAEQAQTVFVHLFKDNELVTPATVADIALNVTDGVHNTVHDDPDGEYLLLSCKNIKGGSLSIGASERKINKETFEKLRRRTKLDKGDVLISSVGTVGELLLLNTEPSNYEFQRSVAIVKPNPEVVSPAYLYESLVCQKAELINAAHGAVQQCLFISDIAGFPIGIPSKEDLRKFDEIVTPMFNEITANEAESFRLADLRDALLPKLMSGELDVSEIEL